MYCRRVITVGCVAAVNSVLCDRVIDVDAADQLAVFVVDAAAADFILCLVIRILDGNTACFLTLAATTRTVLVAPLLFWPSANIQFDFNGRNVPILILVVASSTTRSIDISWCFC